MTVSFGDIQFPEMIPVESAAITISTCFAEEAGELTSLKDYFTVHNHLFTLLNDDDLESIINWFDGRPKSMFLSIWTGNKEAIQYAFSKGMLDEDETIEVVVCKCLESQDICCDCIDALLDEFMTPQAQLKQGDDGRLFVDFDCELVRI